MYKAGKSSPITKLNIFTTKRLQYKFINVVVNKQFLDKVLLVIVKQIKKGQWHTNKDMHDNDKHKYTYLEYNFRNYHHFLLFITQH